MNIPFLKTSTFVGSVSTRDYNTSIEWNKGYNIARNAYTTTNTSSANWSNWSSVSANYALGVDYVKKTGDTMSGELKTPSVSTTQIIFNSSTPSIDVKLINKGEGNIFLGSIYPPPLPQPFEKLDKNKAFTNLFFGLNAGENLEAGSNNVFLGSGAGNSSLSASNNIFIGNNSGNYNLSGNNNTFLGFGAGIYQATPNDNNFIGFDAGAIGKLGNEHNNAFGNKAGYNFGTSTHNNIFGQRAGYRLRRGDHNFFAGRYSGFNIGWYYEAQNRAQHNIFIGHKSGQGKYAPEYLPQKYVANNNLAFGYKAGYKLGAATNTAYSYDYPYHRATEHNIFVGHKSGFNSQADTLYEAAKYNIFMGKGSGYSNKVGYSNIFLGLSAGAYQQGSYNIFLGDNAGKGDNSQNYLTTQNVFIGSKSCSSFILGDKNVCVGSNSFLNGTYASKNVFLGSHTGRSFLESRNNVLIGYSAGFSMGMGDWNTFIGTYACTFALSGTGNVFVGGGIGTSPAAGFGIIDKGSHNTIIGSFASTKTGISEISGSIALGHRSQLSINDQLVIGRSDGTSLSGILYGNLYATSNSRAFSTNGGSSDEWNSAYTTVNSNSATTWNKKTFTSILTNNSPLHPSPGNFDGQNITIERGKIYEVTIRYGYSLNITSGGVLLAVIGNSPAVVLGGNTNSLIPNTVPSNLITQGTTSFSIANNSNQSGILTISYILSAPPGSGTFSIGYTNGYNVGSCAGTNRLAGSYIIAREI